MKKLLLTLLLVITFPFCRAQDTARYTSVQQQQRVGGVEVTDTLHGKFDVILSHTKVDRTLDICDNLLKGGCIQYKVDSLTASYAYEDTLLVEFHANRITSPAMEVKVRVMLKGDDLILVGVVTPWSIIYYEVIKKPEEGKL